MDGKIYKKEQMYKSNHSYISLPRKRTALHWAAHRGHEHVVTALLRSGADPLIKTQKGQTALDLAVNHDAAATVLRAAVGDKADISVGPEPALPIVPTYMQNPDLEKTWLLPEEFSENKVENILRKEKAAELLKNPDQGLYMILYNQC